jgi:hypothetical protein
MVGLFNFGKLPGNAAKFLINAFILTLAEPAVVYHGL